MSVVLSSGSARNPVSTIVSPFAPTNFSDDNSD